MQGFGFLQFFPEDDDDEDDDDDADDDDDKDLETCSDIIKMVGDLLRLCVVDVNRRLVPLV